MVTSLVGLKKHFFVESLLLRIRLSTGKKLSPNSNFCLQNRFQKFSMDFSEPCMTVYVFIPMVIVGCAYKCITYACCENDESSVDSSSMDSPPETAAPMQVPFQQSNTRRHMHQTTMQSYQDQSTNSNLPWYYRPPPTQAETKPPPPDLPPPPTYAESTWN